MTTTAFNHAANTEDRRPRGPPLPLPPARIRSPMPRTVSVPENLRTATNESLAMVVPARACRFTNAV